MAPPLRGKNLILYPPAEGGAHETHPLVAACRHPAVRQRPGRYAKVEERQGEPRLPARTAERSWQEHQGRARRIRPGRLLASEATRPALTQELRTVFCVPTISLTSKLRE